MLVGKYLNIIKLLYIIMLILFLSLLSGCQSTEETVKSSTLTSYEKEGRPVDSTSDQTLMENENQYRYINPGEIDWVTMQGGLHINTKVLFPGHDDEKISRIVFLINSGTDKMESTKIEVGVIHSKARPVGIYIQLKNGNKVYIWPSYTTKTFKDGWSATPVEDKFVLNIEDNSQDEYSTILSGDVAKYIREGWKDDMPMVREIEVSSESCNDGDKVVIREGDKAVVSGDGYTAKEVTILIMRNGNPRESYMVGKVVPDFGKWEWKGTITRQFKTLDGKEVTLAKDLYDIIADDGKGQTGVCAVIDLRNE